MDDLQEPEDDEMQYAVKLMFIELVKLCQYIEGILSLRHDVMPSGEAPLDQIKVCDETLHHWLENLPPAARRQEPGLLDTGKVNTAALYRAVLHAAYKYVLYCSLRMERSLTIKLKHGDFGAAWTVDCVQHD